jgi:hypothetical protein
MMSEEFHAACARADHLHGVTQEWRQMRMDEAAAQDEADSDATPAAAE